MEDVLAVVRLARLGGVRVEGNADCGCGPADDRGGDPGLMPVPLFESIEDLRRLPRFAVNFGFGPTIAS